jgi:hypothetical protein
MDARRAARLSRQWLVLLDGAIAVALVSGEADAALDAQKAAQTLLDAEGGSKAKAGFADERGMSARTVAGDSASKPATPGRPRGAPQPD